MGAPIIIAIFIALISVFLFFTLIINRKERSERRFKRMVSEYNKPPAYSLDEQKTNLMFDLLLKMFGLLIIPLLFMTLLGEMSLPLAVILSFLASGACFYFAAKNVNQIYRLKKGIRAELLVGMRLESGLDSRFTVLHDFQLGDDYNHGSNIDHLVIGPRCIYIIETKYKSCSIDKDSKLQFDGEFVTNPDGCKSNEHIKQVQGLIKQFKDYCKREFDITEIPVNIDAFLVYPGWNVDFRKALHQASATSNIKVNAPELMLKAMMKVAGRERSWVDAVAQDELVRHLTKKNKVKMKLNR
ncbi:MAG: nuclease-related domain-containing protein [Bacteroidota bacterium]